MNVSVPTVDEIHDVDDLDIAPYAGRPSAARLDEVRPVDDGDQDRIIGANVSAEVAEAAVPEPPAEVPAPTYVLSATLMFVAVEGQHKRRRLDRGDVVPGLSDDDIVRLTRARAIVKAGELTDRSDEVPPGSLPPSQMDKSWHDALAKGLLHPAPPKRKSSDDEAPPSSAPSSAQFPPGALLVGGAIPVIGH